MRIIQDALANVQRVLRLQPLVGLLCGVIVVSSLILYALKSAFVNAHPSDQLTYLEAAENARALPLSFVSSFSPKAQEVHPADPKISPARIRLRASHDIDLSLVLHVVQLQGPRAPVFFTSSAPSSTGIDVLCDESLASQLFGSSPMTVTDWGLCYVGADPNRRKTFGWRNSERHRDQLLATMAAIGIPLARQIETLHGKYRIRDVLSDSLAQFQIKQRELPWSAYAYALYLTPPANWTDRFGETHSLDEIANELLGRSLVDESCCGMHVLFALSTMHRVADRCAILEHKTREHIDGKLRDWLHLLIEAQHDDGKWDPIWWDSVLATVKRQRRSLEDDDRLQLIATSHIADWLTTLPQDYNVPQGVVVKAKRWLEMRVRSASDDDLLNNYCGFSHALFIINKVGG